jgi:signal transduction histidine kinase
MAAKAVYQSLISLNLTQGTYEILANETKGVLVAASSGSLEELKALHLSSIHADYQETFQSMFSPEALVKSFEAGQDLIYMELRQKNPSGVYFWASTQVVRVPNHYTDDILAVAMCRSIETERQLQEEQRLRDEKAKALLEQALQKSQAASLAKNEFLSKVSHDIRTPLNAILGMTSLAKANMSATKDLFQTFDESLTKTSEIQELINDFEKLSGYLANIKISGEHLLGLVNEILDLSSMESGRIGLEDRTFDIEHLVSDVSALMQTRIIAKQQTLLVEVEPTIHTLVSGDQHKLRQVLFSILENASKYSSEHDKILFSVTDETAENAHSGLYRFIIQDEGIGMTQDFLEHIYEPFARADDTRINKVAGTGLGLTISKNIITMMGGDLHVESEYGKGSRFEIRLPLEKRAPIESDPPNIASSSNTDFSTRRILVAEDNDMNQEIMHEMIELIGANVVIVGDGALATQLISEHPADFFDLILMDIRMPGTNGYEATKQIRSLPIPGISNLPIIALTADAFRDDIKKAKQAGMNGHVAKPITLHKLKDIITQCQIWRTSGDVMTFYEDF